MVTIDDDGRCLKQRHVSFTEGNEKSSPTENDKTV